ncbi:hypothetical protein L1077_22120 [Pseudoalteromonas luteoviolacea]|uniref:hypothetical protein n=1 Tax=Pseudoalteromonas luteoviolacea TaxID=43657 RepID=UPI001F343DBF|nr:hypothetical protein [Pseudoalteromonas luteoviolacea]MCF6442127.1 hypothetical protein [Pseudoalteromonas luteoviolacea]
MDLFENLIDETLLKACNLDIYTFAIYYEHESGFVSICIDTEENSKVRLAESNKYSMKYFRQSIIEGDLEQALLWQANIGRNLSLGDFTAINIVEKYIEDECVDSRFYLDMVNAIESKADKILKQSSHGGSLLFCCSTAEEEVGLTWVRESA